MSVGKRALSVLAVAMVIYYHRRGNYSNVIRRQSIQQIVLCEQEWNKHGGDRQDERERGEEKASAWSALRHRQKHTQREYQYKKLCEEHRCGRTGNSVCIYKKNAGNDIYDNAGQYNGEIFPLKSPERQRIREAHTEKRDPRAGPQNLLYFDVRMILAALEH